MALESIHHGAQSRSSIFRTSWAFVLAARNSQNSQISPQGKVLFSASTKLRNLYLAKSPGVAPEILAQNATLADLETKPERGLAAKDRWKAQQVESLSNVQTKPELALHVVAATDLLHQADGFFATARVVQSANKVFCAKLLLMQQLGAKLSAQTALDAAGSTWVALVARLPILERVLSCLSLPGNVRAARPWHTLFWLVLNPFQTLSAIEAYIIRAFSALSVFKFFRPRIVYCFVTLPSLWWFRSSQGLAGASMEQPQIGQLLLQHCVEKMSCALSAPRPLPCQRRKRWRAGCVSNTSKKPLRQRAYAFDRAF